MMNKLALLPLLALVVAAPAFADGTDAKDTNHRHHHGQMAHYRGEKHMDDLNLTPEQKTKMEQLKADSRAQMDAVLTPEQQQQAKTRQDRRQAMRGNRNLNLSAEQQAKINTIRQSSEEQLNALLTPELQAQRKAHRHGNRPDRAYFGS